MKGCSASCGHVEIEGENINEVSRNQPDIKLQFRISPIAREMNLAPHRTAFIKSLKERASKQNDSITAQHCSRGKVYAKSRNSLFTVQGGIILYADYALSAMHRRITSLRPRPLNYRIIHHWPARKGAVKYKRTQGHQQRERVIRRAAASIQGEPKKIKENGEDDASRGSSSDLGQIGQLTEGYTHR